MIGLKDEAKKSKKYVVVMLIAICLIPIFSMQLKANEPYMNISTTQKRLLPIYCVNTGEEKKVALTFDAAWGASDTDELIRIMDQYGVKATFFVVGDWARKYPDAVKKLSDAGHDIANHSDKHPHVARMTKEDIIKDALEAHETIKSIIGKEVELYRPPYGEYNNTVIEAADACHYYTIQWDVDSLDWKEYGLEPLIDRVVNHKNLRPGSIILMHNDTKYTAKALEAIIKGVQDKGFTFVPVSELIMRDAGCTLDHEGRQQPSK